VFRCSLSAPGHPASAAPAAVRGEKSLRYNGASKTAKGKLIIEAQLTGLDAARAKPIFATALQHSIKRDPREAQPSPSLSRLTSIRGEPKEIAC
jgi:hypothetical protein